MRLVTTTFDGGRTESDLADELEYERVLAELFGMRV
jgi:hypothetical protein